MDQNTLLKQLYNSLGQFNVHYINEEYVSYYGYENKELSDSFLSIDGILYF